MIDQLVSSDDQTVGAAPVGDVTGGCLLSQHEAGWVIQCGNAQSTAARPIAASELAALVEQVTAQTAKTPRRCVIAIDGADCFFIRAPVPDRVDVKDRTAISFELERHFPLDAEAMTSDYAACESATEYCALAAQTDRFRDVVSALEESGIEVVAIVPRSYLTARGASLSREDKNAFDCWLFDLPHCETLRVDQDGVWQWKQFSEVEGLRFDQAFDQASTENRTPLMIVGTDKEGIAGAGLSLPESPRWCERSINELTAAGASLALSGKWGNWLNLRQGHLAPADPLYAVSGPLRWLATAATLCFITLAGASWYRGERIAEESARIKTQQVDSYREAFPGSRPPVLLMRSVRRQHSRTLGSRGGGSDTIELPTPATENIRRLYQGLTLAREKDGARFRLVDINIFDGECQLTVRVKNTEDLGEIAKSLESIGFTVAPPASEQIDPSKDEPLATYQSTISAIWPKDFSGDAPAAKRGGGK